MYTVDIGVLEMEQYLIDLEYVQKSAAPRQLWNGTQRGKDHIAP